MPPLHCCTAGAAAATATAETEQHLQLEPKWLRNQIFGRFVTPATPADLIREIFHLFEKRSTREGEHKHVREKWGGKCREKNSLVYVVFCPQKKSIFHPFFITFFTAVCTARLKTWSSIFHAVFALSARRCELWERFPRAPAPAASRQPSLHCFLFFPH